jgi:nicotinamidase-related amidase
VEKGDKMKTTNLLIIDPQRDFCNQNGSLYVKGSENDMNRLGEFISKNKMKIAKIFVSMDTHNYFQIFHPLFWKNKNGEHPSPFTVITSKDIEDKKWEVTNKFYEEDSLFYLKRLEYEGKTKLIIWPYHCIVGTEGHLIEEVLNSALADWTLSKEAPIEYILKGKNIITEQYSMLKAEIVDVNDESTKVNVDFIRKISLGDNPVLFIAGEALDYCVYNSVKDIKWHLGVGTKKVDLVMFEDCMSAIDPVSVDKIKKEFIDLGIKFTTIDKVEWE